MSEPLRVGVVGAGPWARFVHAPTFAADPRTELVGVWARRPEQAERLAGANGTTAAASVEELFDRCDAVAFAVPPDVQVELASAAARAGKAVLLEKPIALDVDGAQRLADAIGEAGVGSQIVLTWRYDADVRRFIAESADAARAHPVVGGRGWFLSGALLGGPFSTPWRLEHGPLLDLGPHVIDTLDAALGTVVGVKAHGDPRRWVGLLLEHETGVSSEVSVSAAVHSKLAGAQVFTEGAMVDLDAGDVTSPETLITLVGELLQTAAGTPHPLDVHRGLHLQRLLAEATADLARE